MSRTKERSTHARPKLVGLVTALAWPIAACSSSTPTESRNPYGFEEVVYAVRQTVTPEGVPVVADGMGQVMDYGRYVPGGRVEVKNLSNGEIRNILEPAQGGRSYAKADIEGLDVSFDGQRIVFAMKLDGNQS